MGPWQDEPDRVSWVDKNTGYPCLAVRSKLGNWCGYVAVAPGHPCYEMDYKDAYKLGLDEIHGGLTYSRHCQKDKEHGVCHVQPEGEEDTAWWLGFDCAHMGDLVPGMDGAMRDPVYNSYRDIDYVEQQITALASQLVEAKIKQPDLVGRDGSERVSTAKYSGA